MIAFGTREAEVAPQLLPRRPKKERESLSPRLGPVMLGLV